MNDNFDDKNIINNDYDDDEADSGFINHLNLTLDRLDDAVEALATSIGNIDNNVDILTNMLLNSGLFNEMDLKFATMHYDLTMSMLTETIRDELKTMGYTGDEDYEVELDADSVDNIRKEAYNIVLENMGYNPSKI